MKFIKTISFLSLVAITMLAACSDKPDIEYTTPYKLAGEWWVSVTLNGVDQHGHPVALRTYNTASNSNEIWIDDFPDSTTSSGNVWGFQVKTTADLTNLTFSASQVVSIVPKYHIKVDVTDGKVIPGAGHSKTGVAVDSITMKLKFEDDPTHTYELKGHKRTGFQEDEY